MLEIKLCEDLKTKQNICGMHNLAFSDEYIYVAIENEKQTGSIIFKTENQTISIIILDCADINTADGLIRSAAAYAQGKGAAMLVFNLITPCGIDINKIGYNTSMPILISGLFGGCGH